MPGLKASDKPGASFLSAWELHRTVAAADNPADPSVIVETVDLSSNAAAFGNQIWVRVKRTAGTGTVDVTIYRKENGSWAAVAPWESAGSQASMADEAIKKFTDLLAGEYKVVITNIAGSTTWAIHVAHT